jgi:hypothetical protein
MRNEGEQSVLVIDQIGYVRSRGKSRKMNCRQTGSNFVVCEAVTSVALHRRIIIRGDKP